MPTYLGFGAGEEGFALSLVRILLIFLFIGLALSMTQNHRYIINRIISVYQQNTIIFKLFLLFFAVKVFSLSINSMEISQYIMLFIDFLSSVFIMIVTILIVTSEESVNRLMKIIFYGYNLVLILVVIEYIVQNPVYGQLASDQIMLLNDVTEGLIRGGMYRVSASFTNSIVLAQYLVTLLPIIIAYIYKNNYALAFKLVYFLWFLFAIYVTGSRSAFVLLAVLVYSYLMILFFNRGRLYKITIFILNIIILSTVFYFVYNYISELNTSFTGRFDIIEDEGKRSSTSRALQYIRIYEQMHEAPFLGFGRARNYTDMIGGAIDNYYFWIILEVGLIGIIIYLAFFSLVLKAAFDLYKLSNTNYYLLPILLTILIILSSMFLLQTPDNHIYLYIFAGIVSGMKVLQTNKSEKS